MSKTASSETAGAVTPERILQMGWGFAPPLIIDAAIENKIFDKLDGKSLTADELAAATGASVRGVKALTDALVGLGLLEREGAGSVKLSAEAAAFLVSSKPAYQGGYFKHVRGELIPNWLKLPEVTRTGEPAQRVETSDEGAAFFEHFVSSLFQLNYAAARTLAQALQSNTLQGEISALDLAAGSGVWGIAFAQEFPQARVTAVDWERVLTITRKTAEKFGLGERFRYVAGDALEADLGSGHAVALVGHLLHSEGAERSQKLLARIFAALRPGGSVAIAEFMPNAERTAPVQPLLFGVNMLLHTSNGGVFSFEDIREWLLAAGFVNARTVAVPAPSPIVVADKPA